MMSKTAGLPVMVSFFAAALVIMAVRLVQYSDYLAEAARV